MGLSFAGVLACDCGKHPENSRRRRESSRALARMLHRLSASSPVSRPNSPGPRSLAPPFYFSFFEPSPVGVTGSLRKAEQPRTLCGVLRCATRRVQVQWMRDLLVTTSARPPVFHCFGLHEWAMLFRPPGAEEGGVDARSVHQTLPLRVSQEQVSCASSGCLWPVLACLWPVLACLWPFLACLLGKALVCTVFLVCACCACQPTPRWRHGR